MLFDYVRFITNQKLIVDVGACDIKVLHVQCSGKNLKILDSRLIDFVDGGFMSQEESSIELQQLLESYGDLPIVLIIPQHLSFSRLTQFTLGPRRELTHSSLRELSGWYHIGEDEDILWELQNVKNLPGYTNAGVLTMVRALDVDDQVQRLGVHETNLIRVTTPSSALAESFVHLCEKGQTAFLLDIGATTTTVVVIESSQAVYSGSFPIGGESLTEVISSYFDIPFDQAETKKREEKLFLDHESTPLPLKAAIESWYNELCSHLEIHFGQQEVVSKELRIRNVYLSGGGSQIQGMTDYLTDLYQFKIKTWDSLKESIVSEVDLPLPRYIGMLGPGWCGYQKQCLMPAYVRQKRNIQSIQFISNILSILAIGGIIILMIYFSVREYQRYTRLDGELGALNQSFKQIQTIDGLMHQRFANINELKDILVQYRKSLDWSRALQTLKDAQDETESWMIFLEDKKSYQLAQKLTSTNATTQLPNTPVSPAPTRDILTEPNPQIEIPGLISQIVMQGNAEQALSNLNTFVEKLKNVEPFGNVDKLPEDILPSHISPEFFISNQTFTLRLDWGGYDMYSFSPEWTNEFSMKLPTNATNKTSSTKANLPPNLR